MWYTILIWENSIKIPQLNFINFFNTQTFSVSRSWLVDVVDFVALALNFIAVGLFQSYKSTKPKALEKLISRAIIFHFKDFGL